MAANLARRRNGWNQNVRVDRWSLKEPQWHSIRANTLSPGSRANLTWDTDLYDLRWATGATLVVDFADWPAGGGCFMPNAHGVSGQLVAQSAEYAACLGLGAYEPGDDQAFTFHGVTMDLTWSRAAAERAGGPQRGDVWQCASGPLNILAVDAPKMAWGSRYDAANAHSLQTLARKTLLVYQVARELGIKQVYSGLLGAGPRFGSRPLALLLHMLLLPDGVELKLHFPILSTCSTYNVRVMEARLAVIVENMLGDLREHGVSTMAEALRVILTWKLATSHCDLDILGEGRFQGN